MGFIEDIEDMPNQYDYSLQFYGRYYRPEYTTIVMVGDLRRDEALNMVKKYFGDWKHGNYKPDIPSEPDQKEPRENHVDWPSETLPLVYVAFRGPSYSDEKKDKAALDLLAPIAFGENSDLYQKLVLKEQKLDSLSYIFEDRADPELFLVAAKLKDVKDTDYVRQQIMETYQHFSKELVTKDKLDSTRSRLRYQFALGMDSSEAIAGALAVYIGLRRTPATIDKLFALYDTIAPADMRAAAAKYFVDSHRTIVTLSTKEVAK
jgi:zinc protease